MTWELVLFALGNGHGLQGNRLELFVNFFLVRFPSCQDEGYCITWIDRFRSGHELIYSDRVSRGLLVGMANLKANARAGGRQAVTGNEALLRLI